MVPPRSSQDAPSLAVVGGGIAGVLLTIALLKHCPQFSVTLYESASAFGEIGAGVGFQPVMVRTMALIDPRIAAAFEQCICKSGRHEEERRGHW
jgi:salicylate hydroxylase